MIEAVIFDLDGVLVDSEQLWNEAKEELTRSASGRWRQEASTAMLGMSSTEWSAYMHDSLGVELAPEQINTEVVRRMERLYRSQLPVLPGAVDAVRSLGASWPLGLASSSNRELIELVLELSGLAGAFAATVSSEEVPRGKPAPDVYLEAARQLGVQPARGVAIEDSGNGMRAAAAAGLVVIAVPNPHYPPAEDALALAGAVVATVADVTPELIRQL